MNLTLSDDAVRWLSDFVEKDVARMRSRREAEWQTSGNEYHYTFNNAFCEAVREFFGRVCAECGKPEGENGAKLSIHHVNYRKDVPCRRTGTPLVVPLCVSCHMKTNHNRDWWEAHLTSLIHDRYGGRCVDPSWKERA